MASGRGDLRERLRIDEIRERATELYVQTVESSDDASEHDASRRGDTAVSGATDGRFELSTWLGSNPISQTDGGNDPAADSEQAEDPSAAADRSSVDVASQTGSADIDAQFDFRGWLADGADDVSALDGTATETAADSAVEQTEQPSAETTAAEASAAEPAGFDFATWVRTGDTDLDPIGDPTASDEEPAEPVADATGAVEAPGAAGGGVFDPVETAATATATGGSVRPGTSRTASLLEIHPVKAATLALFLAFVALAVLSMVGYLPPLGPSTGLAF